MVPINYITNLDVTEFSGGWSGMNHHIHQQLSLRFDVHLADNINPPYSLTERVMSKAMRTAGLQGSFPAFSNKRLLQIGVLVDQQRKKNVALDFFHGSTPWLECKSPVPYAMYLDACFATYIGVYHNKRHFSSQQLNHLFSKEARFLESAAAVFFSSEWAMREARSSYGFKGDNFHLAGLGGAWKDDLRMDSEQSPYFLFVGLDFVGKGGDAVVEAFAELVKEFPGYHLKIVGQQPPDKYSSYSFIRYEGFIDKKLPGGEQKIRGLFSNAYCFVLPSARDITPLVLVEAGSVGCPAIATKSFGIPEIVKNDETGILIDAKESLKDQLVSAMKRIITNKELREKMRGASSQFTREHFTWNRTGKLISDTISESIGAWNKQG